MEDKDRVNVSEPKTMKEKGEVQGLAEKFAQAVIRKNVHAILPEGTKINGIEIDPFKMSRFYDHGPDKIESFGEGNIEELNSGILRNEECLPELMNSHIVSIHRSREEDNNKVLRISFFQDRKAHASRGHYTPAKVQVEFPNEVMNEFLGEISKNPDLLEEFYQKAFDGLDSKENKSPGMRRASADGFYLITEPDVKEVYKIVESYRDQKKNIEIFFNKLKKYTYKNGPYGSGDPFTPD